MTLERLKEIIDHHFVPPFLSEGIVKTKWIDYKDKPRDLEIIIGRRDVWISENGEVSGAGTDMTKDA